MGRIFRKQHQRKMLGEEGLLFEEETGKKVRAIHLLMIPVIPDVEDIPTYSVMLYCPSLCILSSKTTVLRLLRSDSSDPPKLLHAPGSANIF